MLISILVKFFRQKHPEVALVDLSDLPEVQVLNFDDLGISLFLSYESFLSNVMIMYVKVLRLGAVKAIHKIETEHEPQVCYVVQIY